MEPVISCVCPTHGRAHVIGEAVESYFRQRPAGVLTELLILNDCEEQPLVCHLPWVRVVNVPLMSDVCRKFDAAVEMAAGEWIAWWEDDDISPPWRLQYSIIKSGLERNFKQTNAWYWNDGRIEKHCENLFFGSSLFRKKDYQDSGGAGQSGYPDQNAHNNIVRHSKNYLFEKAQPDDIYFIYRWGGVNVVHDSGFGSERHNAVQRNELFRQRTLSHPMFKPGPQLIVPAWKHDYEAMAMEASCR